MDINNKQRIAFLLDHDLKEYRYPFFRKLMSRGYDVDVFHSGASLGLENGVNGKRVERKSYFSFEYKVTPKLDNYDVVIVMQNLRMINLWLLTFNPFRKYKVIHWGIGVSSANGLSQSRTLMSKARDFLSSFSDSIVLYSDYPKPLFSQKNHNKMFVAHNTIENPLKQDFSKDTKDSFLFIGTLNKRKGLEELVAAFSKYLARHDAKVSRKLVIIGEGPKKSNIVNLVNTLGIKDKVIFVGKVVDPQIKVKYFQTALASISLRQAGLSVLESFSFGIPFIAFKNAISGGEHLNIEDNRNGYLVESEEELVDVMVRLDSDSLLAQRLGAGAYEHYTSKRSMENMVDTFVEAIETCLK